MQANSEATARFPVYIVGLEDQDFESSIAKEKFQRSIDSLLHVYPDIIEARATVKSFAGEKQRKHFEVHTTIKLPKHPIEEVFEHIGQKIKRLMTKPYDSPARRHRPSRAETAQARY